MDTVLGEDDVHVELWKACAGKCAYVPKINDLVYYFPQGHLEQFEASNAPVFDMRSKILCRVMNIQLLAEQDTDDVYAQIKLLPEAYRTDPPSIDFSLAESVFEPEPEPELSRGKVESFYRVLTSSDVSKRYELYVCKNHADKCLPPLDKYAKTPEQLLIAKDIHGIEWEFKHTFRGKSPRHMLTAGWNAFLTSKKLVVGDIFLLLRGKDGKLRVGVSRFACPSSFPSSGAVFSPPVAGSPFVFKYKPRLGEFVISLNKYNEALHKRFSVGMKIKSPFELEDHPEKKLSGTIVGIENLISEWRCLNIRWDDPQLISRPETFSPWEIEPLADISLLQKGKRKLHEDPQEQVEVDTVASSVVLTTTGGNQPQPEDICPHWIPVNDFSNENQLWGSHDMNVPCLVSPDYSFAANGYTNYFHGVDQQVPKFGTETTSHLEPLLGPEDTSHMQVDETPQPLVYQNSSSNMFSTYEIPSYNDESHGDELVSWEGYKVARQSISVLERIKTRYPELLSRFKARSDGLQSMLLKTLAEVVHGLEHLTIESINQSQLDAFQNNVADLKINGIEVDGITLRLQQIEQVLKKKILVERVAELSQEVAMRNAKVGEVIGQLKYVEKELEDVTSRIGTHPLTACQSLMQGLL